jgi:hypothetical protein
VTESYITDLYESMLLQQCVAADTLCPWNDASSDNCHLVRLLETSSPSTCVESTSYRNMAELIYFFLEEENWGNSILLHAIFSSNY